MTDARRHCLLQMAIWELSRSGQVKPSVIVRKKMRVWGGGWWHLHPKESRRWAEPGCSWVPMAVACPRDGALHITPPGTLLRPGLQCMIHLQDMQSCPFDYHQLCRVLIFGVFFLPLNTPAASIYNFVSLTTVSCGWCSFISSLPFLLSSSSYKESITISFFFLCLL